jgi:hypothetical protein
MTLRTADQMRILRGWSEISAYMRIGIDKARQLQRDRGWPVVKDGNLVLASVGDIDKWVTKQAAT